MAQVNFPSNGVMLLELFALDSAVVTASNAFAYFEDNDKLLRGGGGNGGESSGVRGGGGGSGMRHTFSISQVQQVSIVYFNVLNFSLN